MKRVVWHVVEPLLKALKISSFHHRQVFAVNFVSTSISLQAKPPPKMPYTSRALASVSDKTKVLLLYLSSIQFLHELSVHDIVHVGLAHKEIFISLWP
jgi:hypothetical protein